MFNKYLTISKIISYLSSIIKIIHEKYPKLMLTNEMIIYISADDSKLGSSPRLYGLHYGYGILCSMVS
jgi:hypothetical protein